MNGYNNTFEYRCVVSGAAGTEPAISNVVVIEEPATAASITTQPVNVTGKIGDNVSFTIAAENALGYQWQIR